MKANAKSGGLHCVICGTDKAVEKNHVGGRNHVAWFTMPFCQTHHTQFHKLVAAAGIDLEYTPDSLERLIRAQEAIEICSWMLLQTQRNLKSELNTGGTHGNRRIA